MASVTFKRGTRAEIEATAKQDGQILMETDQNKKNKMYIDLPDGSRVLIGNSGEAIDTFYDNSTSGLDATNVQNAIDTLNSNFNNYEIKIIVSTGTTSNVGTFSFNYTNELPNGGTLLLAYTANSNYWCKLYGFSNGNCILGISDFNNQNSANIQHTVYSYWLVKKS